MRTRKQDGRTATLPATRVTPAERSAIERTAAEAGIKVSEFIREAIRSAMLGSKVVALPVPADVPLDQTKAPIDYEGRKPQRVLETPKGAKIRPRDTRPLTAQEEIDVNRLAMRLPRRRAEAVVLQRREET